MTGRKARALSTVLEGTGLAMDTPSTESSKGDRPGPQAGWVPALVIVWARHGDDRVGEVFLVERAGEVRILGRRGEADGLRLPPLRQRPGGGIFGAELDEPGMSRRQLEVRREGEDAVWLRPVGRRACRLNGIPLPESGAVARPGDVVEVDRQLLMAVQLRPAVLPPWRGAAPSHPFGHADAAGLVGESPALWRLRAQIQEVAALPGEHVLIHGPSGTGKERVARAVHQASRGGRPLVSRSVVSIPETLLDAELFGNVERFPNPGMRARPGLVGEADGSSLFLDELGEVGHELQARLLRVMDEGEYTPLGAARPRRADVRFIAATNRDPQALKHDLLARFPLRIATPGLDRLWTDIPLIARALLTEIAATRPEALERFAPRADEGGAPRMSPELVFALLRHPFTTHVRELRQLLYACLAESPGPWVEPCAALRITLDPEPQPAAPSPSPSALLARAPEAIFTPEELRRLALQRAYDFDATRLGDADDYPTNRQNAALTLNVLMAKALYAAGWRPDEALGILLARGGARPPLGDPGYRRLSRRMSAFIQHQARALADEGDPAGAVPEDLRRYGAQAEDVLRVRRALRDGSLPGA